MVANVLATAKIDMCRCSKLSTLFNVSLSKPHYTLHKGIPLPLRSSHCDALAISRMHFFLFPFFCCCIDFHFSLILSSLTQPIRMEIYWIKSGNMDLNDQLLIVQDKRVLAFVRCKTWSDLIKCHRKLLLLSFSILPLLRASSFSSCHSLWQELSCDKYCVGSRILLQYSIVLDVDEGNSSHTRAPFELPEYCKPSN